jgi:hypothetical protein
MHSAAKAASLSIPSGPEGKNSFRLWGTLMQYQLLNDITTRDYPITSGLIASVLSSTYRQ